MKLKLFTLILFVLHCALTIEKNQNYLVLKNDKVFALNYIIHDSSKHTQQSRLNSLRIVNDQQSIQIQIPIQILANKQHKTVNLTQQLPIFSSLLSTKGYLKPQNPFRNQKTNLFVKGYKYIKPAYHDQIVHQTYEEIQAFVKALIKTNNLTYFNLRMQDSFQIQVLIDSEVSFFTVQSIKIQYLFASITKTSIPIQTLNILSQKTLNHEQFLSKQRNGFVLRKLQGKGFHQTVNHTIAINMLDDIKLQQMKDRCFYQFTDVLPQSTYIDSDQRRTQTTNYQTINIQKPAFASKQYFYKFRVPYNQLTEVGISKYLYQQPIHFRYPSPSLLNITKVYLHSIEQARIVCQNINQQNSQPEQIVYNLQQDLLFERGTANIPNGDISKSKFVSMATLIVCLISVLLIIKNLKKN